MLALDAVGLDQVLPIELDHLLLQLRLAQRGADLAVWVAETEEILLLGTGRLQQHIGERILAGADEVLLRWWTELPFDCLHRKLGPGLALYVLGGLREYARYEIDPLLARSSIGGRRLLLRRSWRLRRVQAVHAVDI